MFIFLKLEELKENPFSELGLALDDSIRPDLYISLYDNKKEKRLKLRL
ncbi:MAG: hypothetical protein L6U99_06145 [Clostridium sp.]|nr:MAG: hypothetical protein L6U99_06145 [Clostridium sp.]